MTRKATEATLSKRLAMTLGRESSDYWTVTAEPLARIDADAARARAREILDLVGEAINPTARERWRDFRVNTAVSILGGFGDGYAIHSITWPKGVPRGSLPDRASTDAAIRDARIDKWWSSHGAGSLDETTDDSRADEQFVRLAEMGLAADLETLRTGERPEWTGFAEASGEAAERLTGWLTAYRTLRDRATSSDGSTYLRTLALSGRDMVVDELAYARRVLLFRQTNGAQAEAIAATILTLFLARSAFLATTAVDRDDWMTLHLVTSTFIQEFLDTCQLAEWLDQART